jgi:hypothetical protein
MPDKAVSSNDNELLTAEEGGLAYLIPLLFGLKQDLSKNASASFLRAWNPDGSQIEFVDLIIEQLLTAQKMDPVDLSDGLASSLKDQAVLGLLPEADAFQIVNMLNIVKLTGSASR